MNLSTSLPLGRVWDLSPPTKMLLLYHDQALALLSSLKLCASSHWVMWLRGQAIRTRKVREASLQAGRNPRLEVRRTRLETQSSLSLCDLEQEVPSPLGSSVPIKRKADGLPILPFPRLDLRWAKKIRERAPWIGVLALKSKGELAADPMVIVGARIPMPG